MKAAAENPGGAMTGFMGVGMAAGAGGMNAQNLFAMGQEQAASQQTQTASATSQTQTTADKLTCPNGHEASGKFCPECGSPKPVSDSWTCTCGTVNNGKFCSNCGQPKPAVNIVVAIVAGNQKMLIIHLNSALNVAMYLMKMTLFKSFSNYLIAR